MIQGEGEEKWDRGGEDEVLLVMVEVENDVSAHNHQFEVILLLLGGIFEVEVGVVKEEVGAIMICTEILTTEDHDDDNHNNEHILLMKVSDHILLHWTIPLDEITVVLQCRHAVEVLAGLHRNNNFRNVAEEGHVEHYHPPRGAMIRVHHDLIIAEAAAIVEVQCNSTVDSGVGTVDDECH